MAYNYRFPSSQFLGFGQMIAAVTILQGAKFLGLISFPDCETRIPQKVGSSILLTCAHCSVPQGVVGYGAVNKEYVYYANVWIVCYVSNVTRCPCLQCRKMSAISNINMGAVQLQPLETSWDIAGSFKVDRHYLEQYSYNTHTICRIAGDVSYIYNTSINDMMNKLNS